MPPGSYVSAAFHCRLSRSHSLLRLLYAQQNWPLMTNLLLQADNKEKSGTEFDTARSPQLLSLLLSCARHTGRQTGLMARFTKEQEVLFSPLPLPLPSTPSF
jgi:hypothetical protein